MNLTDGLTEHLQDVDVPSPDLHRVVERGQRIRARRQVTGMTVAAAAVLAVITLVQPGGSDHVTTEPPIATGPLDLSDGLQAYGDPGRTLVLAGRKLPAEDLQWLDTDAVATSDGVVYFRDGRPFLLGEDGRSRSLWDGPVDEPPPFDPESPPDGFHPTAKYDPAAGVVAFAVRSDKLVQLVLRDLTESAAVSLPLDCDAPPGCRGVVVDGVDSGTVFVRTDEGTYLWDYAAEGDQELQPFAGPRTRVADVRSRTVLYDGPRPTVTLEGWTYVAGAVDSQLTFDGRNILDWSPVLKSIANGEAIDLQLPQPATFFTIDTDGSVLAATVGDPAVFFDCEVPSGTCEEIGRLRMTGGDPMFIGNDM